jgi:hypothetical protein
LKIESFLSQLIFRAFLVNFDRDRKREVTHDLLHVLALSSLLIANVMSSMDSHPTSPQELHTHLTSPSCSTIDENEEYQIEDLRTEAKEAVELTQKQPSVRKRRIKYNIYEHLDAFPIMLLDDRDDGGIDAMQCNIEMLSEIVKDSSAWNSLKEAICEQGTTTNVPLYILLTDLLKNPFKQAIVNQLAETIFEEQEERQEQGQEQGREEIDVDDEGSTLSTEEGSTLSTVSVASKDDWDNDVSWEDFVNAGQKVRSLKPILLQHRSRTTERTRFQTPPGAYGGGRK